MMMTRGGEAGEQTAREPQAGVSRDLRDQADRAHLHPGDHRPGRLQPRDVLSALQGHLRRARVDRGGAALLHRRDNRAAREQGRPLRAHGDVPVAGQPWTFSFTVLLGEKGDPAFVARFKQRLEPLLGRLLVMRPGLDEHRRQLVASFYLSGLVAVVVEVACATRRAWAWTTWCASWWTTCCRRTCDRGIDENGPWRGGSRLGERGYFPYISS